MRISIRRVKLVHTLIFAVLSACVLYLLFSSLFDRITRWTYGAVGAVLLEGLVLAASGGRCPLTVWTEKLGASRGSVTEIFLPKWFSDQIFPVCGSIFLIACVVLMVRVLAL